METWKLLVAISVVLVVFGAIVTAMDVSLSPLTIVLLLAFAAFVSTTSYLLGKRGYRVGRVIGEAKREREEE